MALGCKNLGAIILYKSNIETKKAKSLINLWSIVFAFFYAQNQNERNEFNVKIFYVRDITRRNRTANDEPPNFSLRRSGIVINNYFNCEGGGVKCNYCEKINGASCYTDICFHLKERFYNELHNQKIDMIITKFISRFARNTLDFL